MKKLIMPMIGISLFVAAYQHTRRQAEYIAARSASANRTSYILQTPASATASLKGSAAFKLTKPS